MALPKKLIKDAIIEAVIELQFNTTDIPEVVVGQISSHPLWKSYSKVRLPIADIPPTIRSSEPNLRYQPTIEFQSEKRDTLVRAGGNTFSLHVLSPYPGWTEFFKQITDAIDIISSNVAGFVCTRIGLRYVNGLTPKDHCVHSVNDLNMSFVVAGTPVGTDFNVNYRKKHSEHHQVLIRVGSKEFVAGTPGDDVTYLVDVDVSTDPSYRENNAAEICRWVDQAHDYEKIEFFNLLPPKLIQQLKAE